MCSWCVSHGSDDVPEAWSWPMKPRASTTSRRSTEPAEPDQTNLTTASDLLTSVGHFPERATEADTLLLHKCWLNLVSPTTACSVQPQAFSTLTQMARHCPLQVSRVAVKLEPEEPPETLQGSPTRSTWTPSADLAAGEPFCWRTLSQTTSTVTFPMTSKKQPEVKKVQTEQVRSI